MVKGDQKNAIISRACFAWIYILHLVDKAHTVPSTLTTQPLAVPLAWGLRLTHGIFYNPVRPCTRTPRRAAKPPKSCHPCLGRHFIIGHTGGRQAHKTRGARGHPAAIWGFQTEPSAMQASLSIVRDRGHHHSLSTYINNTVTLRKATPRESPATPSSFANTLGQTNAARDFGPGISGSGSRGLQKISRLVPTTTARLAIMNGPSHLLQLVLELSGTFVFGLNGALIAMESEHLDLVGVIVLGMTTALGGGILRDVLIGAIPPAAFRDWRYLAVAAGAGLLAFLARQIWVRLGRLINVFDAAGLSLFCVAGTTTAFSAHLGPVQSALLGTITAVGGGTLRDIAIRRVPTVFSSGLYAVPAAAGATLTAVALEMHLYSGTLAVIAALVCFSIRMTGVHFKLSLPASRPPGTKEGSGA